MNFIFWIARLFTWIFSGFNNFQYRMDHISGCDTLHPFPPYSFGGLKRSEFFRLLEINKSERIGVQMIQLSLFDAVYNIPKEKKDKHDHRRKLIYFLFHSSWRKIPHYVRDL